MLLVALFVVVSLCRSSAAANVISANSPLVAIEGRTIAGPAGGLIYDWVGVSARVAVSNNLTFVTATINDTCAGGNKFVVRATAEGFTNVDVATFFTQRGVNTYVLFGDAGRASFIGSVAEFTLIKAVEARFTGCLPENGQGLTLLSFASDGAFVPPAPRARRLEIIGDSITAGDLVYCANAAGAHYSTANTLWSDSHSASYGSRLCAALGAACTTIAWGGMGMVQNDVRSWTWPTIPDVWPSALGWPVFERGQGAPLDHAWNFSAAPPADAVIIALGTNDAAGDFSNATFAERYVNAYVSFTRGVATTYAAANRGQGPEFFLVNGTCMTTVYAPFVATIASQLAAKGLHATILDLTLPGGARCACGHPSDMDHLAMANGALPIIKQVMGW